MNCKNCADYGCGGQGSDFENPNCNGGESKINTYKLLKSDGSLIIEDCQLKVMQELFKIASENGLVEIRHNENYHATEFVFEGYYCNFSILLPVKG